MAITNNLSKLFNIQLTWPTCLNRLLTKGLKHRLNLVRPIDPLVPVTLSKRFTIDLTKKAIDPLVSETIMAGVNSMQ
jgi:hypothetical protein